MKKIKTFKFLFKSLFRCDLHSFVCIRTTLWGCKTTFACIRTTLWGCTQPLSVLELHCETVNKRSYWRAPCSGSSWHSSLCPTSQLALHHHCPASATLTIHYCVRLKRSKLCSICLSVTRQYWVYTAKPIFKLWPSGSPIILLLFDSKRWYPIPKENSVSGDWAMAFCATFALCERWLCR